MRETVSLLGCSLKLTIMQKCVMVPPAFILLVLLPAFTCSRCAPNIETGEATICFHLSDALIHDAKNILKMSAFVHYLIPGSVEH